MVMEENSKYKFFKTLNLCVYQPPVHRVSNYRNIFWNRNNYLAKVNTKANIKENDVSPI